MSQTGLTIFISGHTTWYSRSLGTVDGENLDTEIDDNGQLIGGIVADDDLEDFDELQEDDNEADDEEDEYDDDDDSPEADLARERKKERQLRAEKRQAKVNSRREQSHKKALRPARYENGRYYSSRCRYEFARIIIDEAHVIRNPNTLLAEAIYQTRKLNVHFLTATPMLNHAKDLRGYLHILFRIYWALVNCGLGYLEQYDEGFNPLAAPMQEVDNNTKIISLFPDRTEQTESLYAAHEAGVPVYLLNPKMYAAAGKLDDWSAHICKRIMPPILKMLLLRIGYETEIDLEDGSPPRRVGDSVPRCDVYTVQLQMNRLEKLEHDDRTLHMLSQLGVGETDTLKVDPRVAETAAERIRLEETNDCEGMIHSGVYRYLKHATLDPRLAYLTELNHKDMTDVQKKEAQKNRRNNWTGVDLDHGASFFYVKTRDGPQYAIPNDRLSLAHYMAAMCVKVRYAMGILADNIKTRKEKTILVFEYPMTLW